MILSARFALAGIVAVGATAATSLGIVPPASAATATTINLNVTGCEGCVFVAHRPNGNPLGTSTPVKNGWASLLVATNKTSKMSFEVQHPLGYSAGNAVSFVVVRYDGFRVGQAVPPTSAAKQKYGALCWAGTSKPSASFKIQVDLISGQDMDGAATSLLRAYASPGKRSIGSQRLHRGIVGINGLPVCN